MQKIILSENPEFYYYKSGDNPKLLIHSGTHGDEYNVIPLVEESAQKYEGRLPNFIFVPMVSPSAVKNRTRVNNEGKDLNRIFFSNSENSEVKCNIEIVQRYKFDLFVSFHEDLESSDYYIYDTGFNDQETRVVINHNQLLKENGITLLNGKDDPLDISLNYDFKDGYKRFNERQGSVDSGMIGNWMRFHKVAKHCLALEIPGKVDVLKKEYIIDTFFTEVVLKFF